MLTPLLRRILKETVLVDDGEGGSLLKEKRELIAAKVVEMAMAGDMDAIKLVIERVDGKVPQPVVEKPTGDQEAQPLVVHLTKEQADAI